MRWIVCGLIFLFLTYNVAFADKNCSIDLNAVSLTDALHILGNYLHQNIVISPEVEAKQISLHLQNLTFLQAFNLVLTTHHLVKKEIGTTWYIAPRENLLKEEQDDFNLQNTLDDIAPLFTRVWQIHYAKAEDIVKMLQDSNHSILSKRGHVNVDNRTNIICIQDTARHLQEIQQLIKKIDVPVRQVLIEARLASIDSDCECELGINFVTKECESHSSSAWQSSLRYSLAIMKLPDCSFLDVQLSALESAGHGELISSPKLFTNNQQTASIESGEEIPYQEVSRSGGTAVAFKKAVLSLKVTPQIMPEDKILLQLQVNQDKPSKRVVLGVPAINTRQIITNVLVKNGQTIVLGGIYESNHENSEQGIPFLGKIPLLGWLFKQHSKAENKRELLIFVTPKIMG